MHGNPNSTIDVDVDPTVCRAVQRSHDAQLIQPPFNEVLKPLNKHVVICCDIAQSQWQSAIHEGINLLWTASFPCPPFSRGSSNRVGLELPTGRAFLFVLKAARANQPLFICVENVDAITSHRHFRILLRFGAWAGYKLAWSHISCLSEISHCMRRRWLAVLVRQDLLHDSTFGGNFKLGGIEITPWYDDTFAWALPSSLEDQLKLDQQLIDVYADPKWLPRAKAGALQSGDRQEVLMARVPDKALPLPTLVASYGTQHWLSESQLNDKGIFADLQMLADGTVAFFPPTMWAGLLGNLKSLFLEGFIDDFFKHLGNAISTPQAALAILVEDVLRKLGVHEHFIKSWGLWFPATNTYMWHDSKVPPGEFFAVPAFAPEKRDMISNGHAPQHISRTISDTSGDETQEEANDHAVQTVKICFSVGGKSTYSVNCSPDMTFAEALASAGCELVGLPNISILVDGIPISLDACVARFHLQTAEVIMDSKRQKTQKRGHFIEIVLLDGQTRFIPAAANWTIRHTLTNAGYPDELISRLSPLHNGKLLHLDTKMEQLESPHIRLACYPLKGGTGKGASKGKSKPSVDSLQSKDPWAGYTPSNAGCRWDQLVLPEKHQFFCANKNLRLPQIPLSQLSNQHGGIFFATKSSVHEFAQTKPPNTSIALLPGFRGFTNVVLPDHMQALPAVQITVKEPGNGPTYKRLAIPVLICGKCEYKVEDSSQAIAVTSEKFIEMVLEMHEAILSKPMIDLLNDQPLMAFKKALAASQLVMAECSIYSYRRVKAFDHGQLHQAIIKVPRDSANLLLRFSGSTDLFVRQYLNPGDAPDHSILPRYWSMSSDDLRAINQLGSAMGDPCRGVAITAKGLALRADNAKLAEARQLVLQGDIRFGDLNRHVVARFMYQAQGYPFELSHESLIKSTKEALSLAPIPLRSFRIGGIHTWILAFDQEVSVTSFSLKMDAAIYEVILAPPLPNKPKISKNRPKKKDSADRPQFTFQHSLGSSQVNASGDTSKVASLEARVTRLETQQTQLSEKVDQRFDQVSSQLQQVLAAVTPAPHGTSRPRQGDATGETPPPKVYRQNQ
eukprot:Skav227427  [mRNA]  locus=scaffold1986:183488:186964:- [translate_table: standard]